MKKTCNVCGGKIVGNKCVQCGFSKNNDTSRSFSEVNLNNNSYGEELHEQEKNQQINQNENVSSGTQKEEISEFKKFIIIIVIVGLTMFVGLPIIEAGIEEAAHAVKEFQNRSKIEGNTEIIDLSKYENNYKYVEKTISETGENYSKTLMRGDYQVGVHIPEGVYTAKTNDTKSSVSIDDNENGIDIFENSRNNNKEIKDKKVENIEYRNMYLFNGATLEVYSVDGMELTSENAQTSTLEKVEPNDVRETIEIKNEYVAGIDFPEGTYDIELTASNNQSPIMKYEGDGTYGRKSIVPDEEKTTYYNIEFKTGTKVTFKDMDVWFTTSEFNTIGIGDDTE